ncbi:hypothetical protein MJM28_27515, partial [Salmonella enterica subsp. enterica serovar Montevideo]|nr:hypothetical protein [Salmonella enterica subsp. enterica serovar Montevideo]
MKQVVKDFSHDGRGCSCVASPTPPDPKGPPKPKWIELKGYCVTCNSQEDIRPPKEG